MKCVILAGGMGTRISEETHLKPKPMVEIGSRPILWHIMKVYSYYGINDFVICLGYKGYMIKEYFANYFLHQSDVTFDLSKNSIKVHNHDCEPWKVTLVDTGEASMTGGRLKRVQKYVDDEAFCFTYGDGVSDIDIAKTIVFHKERGTLATLTAVQLPGRFGSIAMKNNIVEDFEEKPHGDGGWINGGFFVLEPEVFNFIEGDHTVWEAEPLRNLTESNQLSAYKHHGFWQSMDTLRDRIKLEELWKSNNAPWRVWE